QLFWLHERFLDAEERAVRPLRVPVARAYGAARLPAMPAALLARERSAAAVRRFLFGLCEAGSPQVSGPGQQRPLAGAPELLVGSTRLELDPLFRRQPGVLVARRRPNLRPR